MTKIGIILGTTRPGRNGEQVAKWVLEQAQAVSGAQFDLVDLADYPLPMLDEPAPASFQQYANDHTKAWSAKIKEFDGFIFVTPEYNHSITGVLKNSIDFLYKEWNNKAAAIVSYGGVGGARAAEQLRLILAEVQIATVRQGVTISLMTEFENFRVFKPNEFSEQGLAVLFEQLLAWTKALEPLHQAA